MLALEQVLQLFANMSRTLIAAGVAGALFSSAWWIFIDAFASAQKNNDPQPFLFLFLLPGLFATLGLMLINLVDWSKLSEGQSGFSGEDLTGRSRCFLFTGVLVAFAAFGVSIWIMISKYANRTNASSYPGIAIIVSTFLILLSAIIMRFGRSSTVAYSAF